MRQFLTAKFRPGDRRAYTYHNDGPAVAVGDKIKVPDRSGNGWVGIEVVGLLSDTEAGALPFKTKPIIGKVEEAQPDLLTAPPATGEAGEWRPFQSGDAIPQHGMFEVHYRAELDPPRAPEIMPADRINWQHVSRFRSAPDAPAVPAGHDLGDA